MIHENDLKFFFKLTLIQKNPKTVLFLVCIFLYSDWIQENTDKK